MSNEQILTEIVEIFRDILDDENITLTTESTAKDVEEWDSLSHVQLVVAIEKHFKVRFNTNEISRWKNVGEMVIAVASRATK